MKQVRYWIGNDVLSAFSNELGISNTLTFECLNLFNKCGVGNEHISKSEDYVRNTEMNEQNFIQYYYATKILLESGNANIAEKYLEKIETYISILKQKYGSIQDFSYIDVLYKDILSYYPNKYPKSELIWKETLELKPSNLYLDTIKVYVEIANRLDVRPSSNDLIEVNNQLKRYITITGYCPVSDEKYTTLQATYSGLYVEYCLKNIK